MGARISAALCALLLAACASPGSRFPVVQRVTATDASADCDALGGELRRIAVLRREIGREAGRLDGGDTAAVAVAAAISPTNLLTQGIPALIGASLRDRRYGDAINAADARMLVLTRLRAERDCLPAGDGAASEHRLAEALSLNEGDAATIRRVRADAVESYLGP